MSSGREQQNSRNFSNSNHLNLTIGSGDDEDEDYDGTVFDVHRRMQNFAMADDDGGMPPTVFLDDTDVVPTTSTALVCDPSQSAVMGLMNDAPNMDNFVKNFFATDACLFHNTDSGNFVEEVFTEKPPKIIGEYLFGGVIGEGSYSKVKEVIHIRTLMRRAVKIIKDKRLKKIPGGEENVRREIQVLQRIKHTNVVELIDIFRIDEKQKLYIIMEFCVCSLQLMLDHSQEKKLPEFQAQLYFSQLMDGLDYLHSQRIIHKDIKPGNLLLSLDGHLKICDFGVAEELDGNNEDWCTTGQGTPKFQPPEVVSGSHTRFRGQLVDIWSSGVTLYNLVSGEYPFDGDVIMKLFENITSQPLEMPKNTAISASLQELLCGLLEKDPTQRWDSRKIRSSEWFITKFPTDINRIVRVPDVCETADHSPSGVYRALAQMYEGESEQEPSPENSEVPTISNQMTDGASVNLPTNYIREPNACEKNTASIKVEEVMSSKAENPNYAAPAEQNADTNGSQNTTGGASRLSKIFRRKNLSNFLQRLIF